VRTLQHCAALRCPIVWFEFRKSKNGMRTCVCVCVCNPSLSFRKRTTAALQTVITFTTPTLTHARTDVLHCRETNLKRRLACMHTQDKKTEAEIQALKGEFVCEPPNTNLEKLNGTFYYTNAETKKDTKAPASNENVLLRGCSLRNTDFAVGLVIYVGPETKQFQNAGPLKRKVSERTSVAGTCVTLHCGGCPCTCESRVCPCRVRVLSKRLHNHNHRGCVKTLP
jgi:hypothetical protein